MYPKIQINKTETTLFYNVEGKGVKANKTVVVIETTTLDKKGKEVSETTEQTLFNTVVPEEATEITEKEYNTLVLKKEEGDKKILAEWTEAEKARINKNQEEIKEWLANTKAPECAYGFFGIISEPVIQA